MQKSGLWPRLLLWPLVRGSQDARRVHTGVRLRDLDLGCDLAWPPAQDHWGSAGVV